MEYNEKKTLTDYIDLLSVSMKNFDCKIFISNSEICIIASKNDFIKIVHFIKDHPTTNFSLLVDMCAVDHPDQKERFEIIYNFLSISQNLRLRLKLRIHDNESVESISNIYPCSNWYEREIWDLFGISFINHPDLRRILTDYGFEGHPLRKDFPLTGFVQVRYDDEKKQVINEPVKLDQEYRSFENLSPWEGIISELPGDEKKSV